jgi:aquaporin Z
VQHPASPVRQLISSGIFRRAIMGLGLGATLTAIVLSPWGKQSGGHFNPAVTFAFYRLGKVEFWDTWFYVASQFSGAAAGVALAGYTLPGAVGNRAVNYAVTVPGVYGKTVAFVAELAISFILMLSILVATNRSKLVPYAPYIVGVLIAIYITFESPLSGMSTNPARTFGSAFHACYWHALWIYFVAPTLGMLATSEFFLRTRGGVPPFCSARLGSKVRDDHLELYRRHACSTH